MRRTIHCIVLFAALPLAASAQEARQVDRPVDQSYINRLAAGAEPGGKGTQDRLAQYVSHFRHEAANDVRLFAFNVAAEAEGQRGVRLSGYVEFPETRNALVAYFKELGFDPVANQIKTLPAKDLGQERFGFIKSDHSLSYAEPEEREVVTDCLLGEPLFLLRAEKDHFLVHGGDGYLGWVAARDVHRVDEAAFAEYLKGPRVCLIQNQIPKDSRTDVDALAGSRLKYVGEDGDDFVVQLPTGEKGKVAKSFSELRDLPADKIDVVCTGAKELLGTNYLWGGKTSGGVDCSGLVQVSFAGAGVTVPRDANQQFHMGQLTGTRWSRAAMRRGDTLYFINPQGRISHTGLYLGDDQFIHAVSPVVVINSFNPDDKNYDPARHASFAFAKRVWE
jgi:cell wall-associated NlpC family hydrolase